MGARHVARSDVEGATSRVDALSRDKLLIAWEACGDGRSDIRGHVVRVIMTLSRGDGQARATL
eukprot:CAMPEP_0181176146 /NCGR_PEP_ID=MMETSP1096-20121128/4469_1 /TAXON_ID=156174 ORGANISM="Chrysochromulina ericina, Strain CCMP281" /NCGR_SAMPLE_ID=MMETSP1096 /ASSEMBLY_ACC=CAM_ASM_000453 /LENGTH=62 /DNA_ID=CAMNT_0023264205 /DNA_START=605 /DNA_END=793 /DNA_ORIENTATION=-